MTDEERRRLKQQLQPKLNVPRVAGGGDPAEGRGAEKVVRQVEVWMIEMKPNGDPETVLW